MKEREGGIGIEQRTDFPNAKHLKFKFDNYLGGLQFAISCDCPGCPKDCNFLHSKLNPVFSCSSSVRASSCCPPSLQIHHHGLLLGESAIRASFLRPIATLPFRVPYADYTLCLRLSCRRRSEFLRLRQPALAIATAPVNDDCPNSYSKDCQRLKQMYSRIEIRRRRRREECRVETGR